MNSVETRQNSSETDAPQADDGWVGDYRAALSVTPLSILGPFELLSELGRGGQGVTHLARDTRNGERLAVKRLHGRAASSTLAQTRLLREAECLRQLDHPCIVRCRGIEWVDDEPLLLMEGVDGPRIDEWARANLCGSSDEAVSRIAALTARVCDAVTHVHERGILHLDLKPSNIRVLRDGDDAFHPRLLDFGMAMAVNAAASDDVLAWVGGTSGYVAPELQARADRRPDVRCDVFALGVLLDNLIGGRGAALPSPSVRQSPVERRMTRQLRSIVQVATQADPDMRYPSVAALSADIRKVLDCQPIRLPRVPLRSRLIPNGSHKLGIAVGLAIVFVIAAVWLRTRAAIDESRDQRPTDHAAAQLITNLVQQSRPGHDGPRAAMLDGLPAMARFAANQLGDQPQLAAEVLKAVGGAYRSLWQWNEAEPLLERSVSLFTTAAKFDDPAAIDARADLGRVLTSKRDPQAVDMLREVLAARSRTQGRDDPRTLYATVSLAYALHQAASPPQWDDAESLFQSALADYARVHGPRHRDIASCLHNFGYMRLRQRRLEEADALYGQALQMFDELGEADDPWRLECMHGYSSLLISRQRFGAAVTVLNDAIPRVRKRFGDAGVQNLLWRAGYAHAKLGRVAEMNASFIDAFATCIELEESRRPTGSPQVAALSLSLANSVQSAGATVPLDEIYSNWNCLSLGMQHAVAGGLLQYAEALAIVDDPAAGDAIIQFLAGLAPRSEQ